MAVKLAESKIEIKDQQELLGILGKNDEFLRILQASLEATLIARGNEITLSGNTERVELGEQILKELLFLYRQGLPLTQHDVRYAINMVQAGKSESLHRMFADTVLVTSRGRQIKTKTLGQWEYLETIRKNTITIGIGPAGTGKTFLAVAMAVNALKAKEVDRVILARPAVEAGEKLGFLPGDLQEKVDPYLRPLYDALGDMLGMEIFQKYLTKGIIEVAPLAYMRGRNLNDSFIILDEAQNTTEEQMKMVLTRLGFGSRMVVTGDITQIDLPGGKASGLRQAATILQDVKGIGIVRFTESDVVRHELVAAIVRAYEQVTDKRTRHQAIAETEEAKL